MRVIAGSARSLKLKTIEGNTTRPTTDRIKETLFNMINPYIYGTRFLDLFSGSGGIGIEALSRGAKECVFVDNNRRCINCIEDNLRFTKLDDKARVLGTDVITAINNIGREEDTFDIIFMDPPYNNLIEKDVLRAISQSKIVNEDTMIIVEASSETEFDYLDEYGFEIEKIKDYKTNKHVFIKKKK